MKSLKARFKFGINNLSKIENWDNKIKLKKSISMVKAYPKRWGFFIKFLALVPKIKNATRLVSFSISK